MKYRARFIFSQARVLGCREETFGRMGAPATMKETVEMLRRSQVVEADRLELFFLQLREENTKALTTAGLLDRLLNEQLITKFHHDHLAQGKWKGLTLGGYRLLDRIASGGMGQVFLGEHLKLKKKVAIKVLAANLTDNETAKMRFVREARAAAALSHENILQVFDVSTETNPPYIVMEYIDGVTLQAAVAMGGPVSPAVAAVCGHQVALALQHAFQNGLVHRDIKPANIIVDRHGICKILDLGIARFDDGMDITRVRKNEKLILGTIEYLAPEQAVDSTKVDCRADLYSLGATLYFLLTGDPPFAKVHSSIKLLKKQTDMPPPVSEVRADVPTGLSYVIQRLLAVRPADRYGSPAEAAHALAAFAMAPPDYPESLFVRVPPREASSSKLPVRPYRYSPTPSSLSWSDEHPINLDDPVMKVTESNFCFDGPTVSVIEQTPLPNLRKSITRSRSSNFETPKKEKLRQKKILAMSIGAGIALIGVLAFTILMLLKISHQETKSRPKAQARWPGPVQILEPGKT